MTVLEKKSLRKKKAIMSLVGKGEYSPAYALILVEELSDSGKLTDDDYEELAEYLESLLDEPKEVEEEVEVIENHEEETPIEENVEETENERGEE
jgi:hypothetical protein